MAWSTVSGFTRSSSVKGPYGIERLGKIAQSSHVETKDCASAIVRPLRTPRVVRLHPFVMPPEQQWRPPAETEGNSVPAPSTIG
jgi:hypothetical protein